jgi:hypothetical protein
MLHAHADAAQGQDHLVIGGGPDRPQAQPNHPLVEFLNHDPQPAEPQFQALEDTLLEPACHLWGGEREDDNLSLTPPVTVFS